MNVTVVTPPLVVKVGTGAPLGADVVDQVSAGVTAIALPNWSRNVGTASCRLVPETDTGAVGTFLMALSTCVTVIDTLAVKPPPAVCTLRPYDPAWWKVIVAPGAGGGHSGHRRPRGDRGRRPGKGGLHGHRVAELVQLLPQQRLAGSRHRQGRSRADNLAAGSLDPQARRRLADNHLFDNGNARHIAGVGGQRVGAGHLEGDRGNAPLVVKVAAGHRWAPATSTN